MSKVNLPKASSLGTLGIDTFPVSRPPALKRQASGKRREGMRVITAPGSWLDTRLDTTFTSTRYESSS
ncbi:UNVERIFIED_CONTAM: hypothetical protein FKN15_006965 [Acipenser sinensis]